MIYQRRLGFGNDLRTVQFTSSLVITMTIGLHVQMCRCAHSHDFDDEDDEDQDGTCLLELECVVEEISQGRRGLLKYICL